MRPKSKIENKDKINFSIPISVGYTSEVISDTLEAICFNHKPLAE